jgi:hypothetical protein
MTQKNKLIVGGVVVVLVAYYLYDRNKKMKAKEDLKAGAESPLVKEWTPESELSADIKLGGTKPTKAQLMADSQKELEFSGSRGNSMTAQYYR